MTVFILIREDQNDHGYIDTSVAGVFRTATAATERERIEAMAARHRGLTIEDEESPDGEWQVSWRIEEHSLA